ncbi:MAG TPA: lipoate--protein ligase family protein [bacterium]|nr:lipoate--protein ligase family protein [bacterium]
MFVNGVRFIPFARFSPYENMAIDEYLLNYYNTSEQPVLRLYSWNPTGISVGKNQDIKTVNTAACSEDRIPVVRRLTGGGAIFHKNELTYCLVCSEKDISAEKLSIKESFEKLNGFLIKMYEKSGLNSAFARDASGSGRFGERSSYCFSGSEEYDITIDGKKIGGNAQCRKKDIIFQHGSIPLERTGNAGRYIKGPIKEESFTVLNEVMGREVSPEEIGSNLVAAFTEVFETDLFEAPLEFAEKNEIVKIMTGKYAQNRWNIDGKTDSDKKCCQGE